MSRGSSRFRLRRFATAILALSFLGTALSGGVLYLRPEGSLARRVGWSVLGFDKPQWEALHIVFVAVFALVSALHLYYNWRQLAAMMGLGVASGLGARHAAPHRELLAAAVLLALVGYGTLAGLPPFSSLLHLRSEIKDGRLVSTAARPDDDPGRLTLVEVGRRASLSEEQIVSNAQQRGITIRDRSATVGAIAREHDLSPAEVFAAMSGAPVEAPQESQ
jgi:hypothetical protein